MNFTESIPRPSFLELTDQEKCCAQDNKNAIVCGDILIRFRYNNETII